MVTTNRYARRSFTVEAVQVTSENMYEVAEWCGGTVCGAVSGTNAHPFIKVNVIRPQNDRQTEAYPGDWITKGSGGFKVFSDKAFKGSFELTPDADEAKPNIQVG